MVGSADSGSDEDTSCAEDSPIWVLNSFDPSRSVYPWLALRTLHASATIGGRRMLLNLSAAYFESLQPRDIDATGVTLLVTDASIGQFRSFQLSSDKLGKRGATVDQAFKGDGGILPNGCWDGQLDRHQ